MSISDKNVVMKRISAATPESPIDVFLADIDGSTPLESVFGGTVGAASRRAKAGKSFVGTFHSKMEGSAVAKTLTKAILSRHRLIKAQK